MTNKMLQNTTNSGFFAMHYDGLTPTDLDWMRLALKEAEVAEHLGEVPIGAVVVCEGRLVAQAHNLKESAQDPLGHAEIRAIRLASEKLGRWRLSDCTLYVTLEPCLMCTGAIAHARLQKIVYATPDPKAGAIESIYQIYKDRKLNHTPIVEMGVLQDRASEMLRRFFRSLRETKQTHV